MYRLTSSLPYSNGLVENLEIGNAVVSLPVITSIKSIHDSSMIHVVY